MKTIILAIGCMWITFAPALAAPAPQAVERLPAEDRPIEGGFEDLFVVGKETGEEHEMLFGLVDVTFGPDGELYVLEERNHRILVYGPDGAFRRSFGREGQGPGEFRLPMTLAITAAGEVAVWDFQNRGYAVFSRDGDYVRNVRWEDWQSGPLRDSLHAWPGGGVVYLPQILQEDADAPEDIDRGAILHEPLGAAGAPVELHAVHHPRRRSRDLGGVLLLDSGPAFAPRARWGVLSDGRLVVADGVEYRVRLVEPESGRVALLERPISARPTSEVEREQHRERTREAHSNPAGAVAFGAGGSGSDMSRSERVRRIVDAIEFADVIPVIRDLRVDADDRLWIQRHGANYFDDGPIDIVSAAGEYLGTLPPMRLPDAFGPQGMAAWMENGRDVEVERVIVRRLPVPLR